ncbi:hypothetical protein KsCSTR_19740 [Candidatus Kuenenia stuttgartiensis]|uniref:Uncharacterized protein n=1 Tax=Kuenenia stuttgartiensis TaxID=174633 RepID=A0A6G7GPV3_KUEST|nr:hypothetical protein KsCSTR_19740 [Candidatus Kuenenia stuttgartiensis]
MGETFAPLGMNAFMTIYSKYFALTLCGKTPLLLEFFKKLKCYKVAYYFL